MDSKFGHSEQENILFTHSQALAWEWRILDYKLGHSELENILFPHSQALAWEWRILDYKLGLGNQEKIGLNFFIKKIIFEDI